MPLTLAADTITFTDQTTISPNSIKWTYITTATNLVAFNKYLTNTTTTGFTVTLPSSPLNGDYIIITDGFGVWSTNFLTVNRNGKNINGSAEDLICDVDYGKVELVWSQTANSWRTSIF